MICCCCGSSKLHFKKVLWSDLIDDWQISQYEVEYIDKQQGLSCLRCNSNLRSMALAMSIMKCLGYKSLFQDFVKEKNIQKLKILEINEAGNLTKFLSQIPGHVLKSYPEIDMMNLPFTDNLFDLVVHSDVLEHIKNPVRGLSECYRVLKPGGFCNFTVPMIVDRMTRSRAGLSASYHGSGDNPSDMLVYTEYGSDAWKHLIQAGFKECRLFSIDYPAAQALVGVK